ncbi:hypothetical protein R3P38DRAFT_2918599 [Favolaschia claudopus]|uniref:Uncharacterized protein n=1 Tax=Favolaschia claudopus TaxID=2862362 RepID=A0AAW0C045_9AGAR
MTSLRSWLRALWVVAKFKICAVVHHWNRCSSMDIAGIHIFVYLLAGWYVIVLMSTGLAGTSVGETTSSIAGSSPGIAELSALASFFVFDFLPQRQRLLIEFF